MTQSVRVATAGLKVVLFSTICRGLARVAGKGLRQKALKVESLKLKGEKEEETQEAHLGDRWGVMSCKTFETIGFASV